MLSENDKRSIERLLSNYNTNCYGDVKMHVFILSLLAHNFEMHNYARNLILQKRRDWFNRYVELQRQWQCTKSVNKFHDSFEMRESYIAPHVSSEDERIFEKLAENYNRNRKPELYIRSWGSI